MTIQISKNRAGKTILTVRHGKAQVRIVLIQNHFESIYLRNLKADSLRSHLNLKDAVSDAKQYLAL